MKNLYTNIICILFFTLFFSHSILAQDGHYWTNQYGTRSMLLSGSVIGGVEDLGAVFYNPGRLGLIENPAFLLSADVYEWNRFRITDAFDLSADISNSDFGGVPSLVAGTFKIGFLKNHSFAYSIIRRQGIDLDFSYKNERYGDVIDSFPGQEFFGGSVTIFQKVKEEWASLTWSYPFSRNISFGITSSVMKLDQRKGNIIELQALSSLNDLAIYRYDRSISFEDYGILWKAGLATSFEKVLFGLTVTTPVVNVSGSANYEFEEFFSGIENVTQREDIYTTSYQEDLEVTYKKPWAIGAGITIPVRKSKIHLSSEWFSGIPLYTMLEAEDHYSQSNGDTIQFTLVDELRRVINFGFGAEWSIKETLSFYSSLSTDFSAVGEDAIGFVSNEPIATNTTFSADYYHYGGGFVLKMKSADITLGATYTGGKQDFARPIDFPDEDDEDDDIFAQDEIATLQWDRWQLVFSFSVKFLKDYADKIQN